MEFEVLLLATLVATVRGIIVTDPVPLTYTLTAGYAAQYGIPSTSLAQGSLFTSGSTQKGYSEKGSQYSAAYPTVHHKAEYTFASPPVRHAEPINYPVPPAPVREANREPQQVQQPLFTSYIPETELLGVVYSPATAVSRMSYVNNYGVSYGY